MQITSLVLLLAAAAAVAIVHSILPDHWVPLAVVARTHNWGLLRVGKVAALAATGHVLVSLLLAAIVAAVGLRFQSQLLAQQGHVVGIVLVASGLGFLGWGLTGHGHAHPHGDHDHRDHEDAPAEHGHAGSEHGAHERDPHQGERHDHAHETSEAAALGSEHQHPHAHGKVVHSHAHDHEVFLAGQQERLVKASSRGTLAGLVATVAVPFGVAASPDLTILPVALAAGARGSGVVIAVLAVFSILTIATFVGLTVIGTAAGYQFKGEWLERNANTITSVVLIAIGVVAFAGF